MINATSFLKNMLDKYEYFGEYQTAIQQAIQKYNRLFNQQTTTEFNFMQLLQKQIKQVKPSQAAVQRLNQSTLAQTQSSN